MAQNRHSAGHKSAADISVDELVVRLVGGVVQSIAEMMDDSKGAVENEAWLWRVLAINCEANARFAEELAKGGRQDICNGSRPH